MQALAYYIEMLQYEPLFTTTIEPPFSADTVTPAASKPTFDIPVGSNTPPPKPTFSLPTSMLKKNRYCGQLKDIFLYVAFNGSWQCHLLIFFCLFDRSSGTNINNIQANIIVEYNNLETILDNTNAKAGYMVESEFNVFNDLQAFLVEYNAIKTNCKLAKANSFTWWLLGAMDQSNHNKTTN